MKVKFNLYEKLFLVIGISFVTLVAVNSQASLLATIFSILCILNAVYAAKGLILGYVFEIFSTFIYIYLSLNQRFYSEVITSLFILLPFSFYGLYNWSKHQNSQSNVINISRTSKKELAILITSQIVLYPLYLWMLISFDCSLPYVSAVSIAVSVSAFYLLAKTSNLSYLFFILKDIIGLILWVYPLMLGNSGNITVLLTNILYGINDVYGLINWNKMLKQQKTTV